MKILHVSCIRAQYNGIYSVLKILTKEQRLLGHNIKVINTYKNNSLSDELFENVYNKDGFQKLLNQFIPDIVIFHSLYGSFDFIRYSKILIKSCIPYLIQLHGALSHANYHKNYLKKKLANFFFYNNFIKRAEAVVYLNKGEYKNSIVPQINPSSLFISNGCYIPQNLNRQYQIDRGILEVIYLGRIEMYHKGLDILLKALDLLPINIKNKLHFSFYGEGMDSLWLQKEIEHFPKHMVEFKGAVYGEQKDYVLRTSNLFILTSRYEGMPMGVLEALSYGIPCIVVPQTNMADDIEDYRAGWITEFDANIIAKTLERVVNNFSENYSIISSNALQLALTYSWDNIAQKSISEYEKILKFKMS